MKVVIENTVCLNAGDAAILIAIMKILRRQFGQEISFDVFDSQPEIATKYYPGIRFHPLTTSLLNLPRLKIPLLPQPVANLLHKVRVRPRYKAFDRFLEANYNTRAQDMDGLPSRILNNLKIYSDADLIVSTGGTYLVEHYNLKARFLEFEKDFTLDKPLVLFTQSLGPYAKADNRIAMKRIAEKALLVLLRDYKSEQNLRAIGVETDNLEVVADTVFALADPTQLTKSFAGPKGDRPKVAISVRDWRHFDGRSPENGMALYKQAIVRCVTSLVREKNAEVVFLSTCQGISEYLFDDSKVAREIVEMLEPEIRPSVSVDASFNTPEDLMEKVRPLDFVISTRMHMAILSLCVGVPVLPISYEFKTTELYRGLGQEKWVTDISEIEAETFAPLALDFSENLAAFHKAAMPEIARQAQSAMSAGKLTADALRPARSSDRGAQIQRKASVA